MSDETLDELRDRAAIRDVMHRYAFGIDRRDWPLFRRCFDDEVEIDLSSFNGRAAARLNGDAWVAGVRTGISGFDATQHLNANHLVTLDGDRARCTSEVQASHVLGGERVVIGGWYDTTMRRAADGWRIVSHTLNVTWREGPERLFAEAARRTRG